MKENRRKDPKYIDLSIHKNDIIKLYNNGMSTIKIAEYLNVNFKKICKFLRRCGITIRNNGRSLSKDRDKIHSFLRKFKSGAERKNILFNISEKEAWELLCEQNKICKLSGEILTFDSYHNMCDGNISLDRIDSSKGYSKENCQFLTKLANNAKNDYSNQDIIDFGYSVVDYNDKDVYRDIL